ncbi:tyrosine-type recombinase/integrase [Aliiglaciecola lipolytica]|uniref:Integrase n=1 Tax=Aliiglaciecola lipolytica E3 TaxID=1127673 RepID=K6YDJ2_9ALTE|nr:integrase family protein [Aliiglaciecola lipolytica]GAC14713.1 hypothetical protein GLIP_2085 [Aliiglaciecola lipolytica E3]
MRLSKSTIDKISPPQLKNGKPTQAFYRDTILAGFGLRVSSGGKKSFIIEKRIKGKVKRITIGAYGAITPEQARAKATELIGSITLGNDPIADKKAKESKSVTLQGALDSYLISRKSLKPATIDNYKVCIDRYLADWKHKQLIDISKDMVETRHREIGQKTESKANNTMRVLRALYNHAMEKFEDANGDPVILINPVSRLSRNRAWYKDKRRTGHLKSHELKTWFQATKQLNSSISRNYLQFVLFTGLRKNEALSLRWSDIDFKSQTLTVTDTKNSDPHTLPLTNFLLALLNELKTSSNSEWVFPGPNPEFHLKEPRTAVDRVAEISNISFTLHDLRRTFITIADGLDLPAFALKRLANHRTTDITASYIISDVERLRIPMNRISDFIVSQINQKDET